MTPVELATQLIIKRLITPIDVTWGCDGPNQFPRPRELHSPLTYHRLMVYRDALGTEIYDEEAGLAALNLTAEDTKVLRGQCAFIREHTTPIPPTPIWANPFLEEAEA